MNRGSRPGVQRLRGRGASFNEAPIHESGKYYGRDIARLDRVCLQ